MEWVGVEWGTKSWSWFTCFWLWDRAPFQAEDGSQDALLWPTDQSCWPSGISALIPDLFWQKGQLVKADASVCLVSVSSNLCVLSPHLHTSGVFLGIWCCCIAYDESYLTNGLTEAWQPLAQPRSCLHSPKTDALPVPALSVAIPRCPAECLHTHHTAGSSCHPKPCVVAPGQGSLPLGAAHKVYK